MSLNPIDVKQPSAPDSSAIARCSSSWPKSGPRWPPCAPGRVFACPCPCSGSCGHLQYTPREVLHFLPPAGPLRGLAVLGAGCAALRSCACAEDRLIRRSSRAPAWPRYQSDVDFDSLPRTLQALLATRFTWGVTALGAAVVFLARDVSRKA